MENLHPEDLLEAIHEFHSQYNYHDSLDELFEEEINQEIEENPRDLSEGTSDDLPSLIGEAQEDIQLTHVVYGSKEESVENFEVIEEYFPLCFTSFQFIRDNFHAIINQQSLIFDLDKQEDNEILDQSSLPLCLSSFVKIREKYEKEDK